MSIGVTRGVTSLETHALPCLEIRVVGLSCMPSGLSPVILVSLGVFETTWLVAER